MKIQVSLRNKKGELLEAKPVPDDGDDPLTVEYRTREIAIELLKQVDILEIGDFLLVEAEVNIPHLKVA